MPQYTKRPVKKIKAKKPVKKEFTLDEVQQYTSTNTDFFNIDTVPDLQNIRMMDSKEIRREKKLKKDKEKYLRKKPPVKRMVVKKPYKSKTPVPQKNNYKVIKGGKKAKRIKLYISLSSIILTILSIMIIQIMSPTGLIELVHNSYAASGSGEGFPIDLSENDYLDMFTYNDNIYVLSNTFLEVYNKTGKLFFLTEHGCINPVVEISDARTLLYDRGGTNLKINNFNSSLLQKKFDNIIITASIGRKGNYAVATKSRGYAAEVEVFDKNFETLYKWYSPEETISAVSLSDDGKKVAVATISVNQGAYRSNLYIFNYNSAIPESKITYDGAVILSLQNKDSDHLMAVFDKYVSSVGWKNGSKSDYKPEASPKYIKGYYGANTVILSGRDNNSLQNEITVLDSNAKVIGRFNVSGIINDITIHENVVYCLKDNMVLAFSLDGSFLEKWDCGYMVKKISAISEKKIIILESRKLMQYELTKNTKK